MKKPRSPRPLKNSDGWATISIRARVATVKAWRALSDEEKAAAAGKLRAVVKLATGGKE